MQLAVMLAIKRMAGVTPEVNLRNPLHTGTKHARKESTVALKPSTDITRCPEQGYQWPHKKYLSSKKFEKKKFWTTRWVITKFPDYWGHVYQETTVTIVKFWNIYCWKLELEFSTSKMFFVVFDGEGTSKSSWIFICIIFQLTLFA